MNCFDCSLDRRTTPALGACTICGAGVCAEHFEVDAHEQAHNSGPGNYTPKVTRAFTCNNCAAVLYNQRPLLKQPARL